MNKKREDFLKIKALIFDKKLRAKYNVGEDDLRRLLRKYAHEYGTKDDEQFRIRQDLCDISNVDNYNFRRKKIEVQQDNRGQRHF